MLQKKYENHNIFTNTTTPLISQVYKADKYDIHYIIHKIYKYDIHIQNKHLKLWKVDKHDNIGLY